MSRPASISTTQGISRVTQTDSHPRDPLEQRTQKIGRSLLLEARDRRQGGFPWVDGDAMLQRMMTQPKLRVAALRFVDVLPTLRRDVALAEHLDEYFHDVKLPLIPAGLGRWGLRTARHAIPAKIVSLIVRALSGRMARRFIAGDSVESIRHALHRLHQRGMGFTLDVLGEAVVSEAETHIHFEQYARLIRGLSPVVKQWEPSPLIDHLSGRVHPRLNVSIKISALYSQINNLDPARSAQAVMNRLRPLMRDAKQRGAFITLDMENYDTKETTLEVFRDILMEDEFRDWPDAGIAMQAYLRDTPDDLASLIDWAKHRGTPVMVRLVRGAYWDYEVIHARQNGWAIPVWTDKADTDHCYEQCLLMLFAGHPHIEVAVATHNIRSLAKAVALAQQHGLSPGQFETQMLYGMADTLKTALVKQGLRLRVYVPFGELIPGMAYLVRRLLENTGSQSFLRMGFAENVNADELLAAPGDMA